MIPFSHSSSQTRCVMVFRGALALAVALVLSACSKPHDFSGKYKGVASLKKSMVPVGEQTDAAIVEIEQDGAEATLEITKTGFFEKCTIKATVDETIGKIEPGQSCAIEKGLTSTGKPEDVELIEGKFLILNDYLRLDLNEDSSHFDKGHFSFSGQKGK